MLQNWVCRADHSGILQCTATCLSIVLLSLNEILFSILSEAFLTGFDWSGYPYLLPLLLLLLLLLGARRAVSHTFFCSPLTANSLQQTPRMIVNTAKPPEGRGWVLDYFLVSHPLLFFYDNFISF